MAVPLIRAHERMDYKRCQRKWYWRWRRGLVPVEKSFGALDLGTWMHDALAAWYSPGGFARRGRLFAHVRDAAERDIRRAKAAGAPDYEIDKAIELLQLAIAVAKAYESHYGNDPGINVITCEVPLEFTITSRHSDKPIANHMLKPDLVYRDESGYVWLMEHKTASQIRTEHLVIDDQARPYGAMAERALRKLGLISRDDVFRGIMYNFMRKALPDLRPVDRDGKRLNKDGSVSGRQPAVQFVRHPVRMTSRAKVIALERALAESTEIAMMGEYLRNGKFLPTDLHKTPHYSCERFCEFFGMCTAEEQGADIRHMERVRYTTRNPYEYPETTSEKASW